MKKLFNILNKRKRSILGLMSGTSCDGLDIALIEVEGSGIDTRFNFLAGQSAPYSKKQKQALLELMQPDKSNAETLCQLNFYLANIWAEMIHAFLKKQGLTKHEIDLIGSHGQTIRHQPDPKKFIDRKISSTLQLGDPSVLAQLCGIPVVGDFRVADAALGGQGAPLIPYFDWIYFSRFKENILAVNIGGISNITFVSADGDFNKLIAFDCGPGNMLIDQAMQRLYNKPYDKDGNTARSGKFCRALFDCIQKFDTFIQRQPPKSTGRELYGRDFFLTLLKEFIRLRLDEPDFIHTITKYTAFAIYENYRKFIAPHNTVQKVAVGGGGAHNSFLMEMLQDYFNEAEVKKVKGYQLNEDFKEAIGFAVLANETLNGKPSNVPQVTGAVKPAVLGKICPV